MPDICAYYRKNICRSCSLLEEDYDRQLSAKERTLRSAFPTGASFYPPVFSELIAFRNKAKIIVSGSLEAPVLGLLDKEILDCPVHDPRINQLLKNLIPFIQKARLTPYDVGLRQGELKALIIFTGDESYLRFVLRSKEPLDRIRKHLPELLSLHPELGAVTVNIQPIHQAVLEGEEEILLGPNEFITQSFGDLKMRFRPQGFVQTNLGVARSLYANAAKWVSDLGIERFVELYSGQGAFSFHCAPYVKEATGVELNPEAVAMALETAAHAELTHLDFQSLDARETEEILRKKNPELVLVNPPRRGLAEAAELLLKVRPSWILYSSCSVESLVRDCEKLKDAYRITRVQLFDMFPHTPHFESLVLLERQR